MTGWSRWMIRRGVITPAFQMLCLYLIRGRRNTKTQEKIEEVKAEVLKEEAAPVQEKVKAAPVSQNTVLKLFATTTCPNCKTAKMLLDKVGYSYDVLLVDDESATEIIADFLEIMGFDVCTGYYDPQEDQDSGTVNEYTGCHYISIG